MLLPNRITFLVVAVFCLAAAALAAAYVSVRGMHRKEHSRIVLEALSVRWEKEILERSLSMAAAATVFDFDKLGAAVLARSQDRLSDVIAPGQAALRRAGIRHIHAITANGDLLYGDPAISDALLPAIAEDASDDQGRGMNREVLRIGNEPSLVVTMPLRHQDNTVGSLVLGAPLDVTLRTFAAAVGAQGSIRPAQGLGAGSVRLDWQGDSVYEVISFAIGKAHGDELILTRDVSTREVYVMYAEILGLCAIVVALVSLVLLSRGLLGQALRPLKDCIRALEGLANGDAAGAISDVGTAGEVRALVRAVEHLRQRTVEQEIRLTVRQHRSRHQPGQSSASSTQ